MQTVLWTQCTNGKAVINPYSARTTRFTPNPLSQISKVAYYQGMVVSTCRHCKQYHLIADNERKLDMGGDYGKRVDEFLSSRGEAVQKLSVSLQELEDNYLVDKDGVLTMVPKSIEQVRCTTHAGARIVTYPCSPYRAAAPARRSCSGISEGLVAGTKQHIWSHQYPANSGQL
jgi:hypothetical protein